MLPESASGQSDDRSYEAAVGAHVSASRDICLRVGSSASEYNEYTATNLRL